MVYTIQSQTIVNHYIIFKPLKFICYGYYWEDVPSTALKFQQ